jgi:hypothetical protein
LNFKQTSKTCGTLTLLHKSKRRPKAGEEDVDNSSMISILVTKTITDGVATITTMAGEITTTITATMDGEMKTTTMDGEITTTITATMDGEMKTTTMDGVTPIITMGGEIKVEIKAEIKAVLFGVIFRVETGSMKCRNIREIFVPSN